MNQEQKLCLYSSVSWHAKFMQAEGVALWIPDKCGNVVLLW